MGELFTMQGMLLDLTIPYAGDEGLCAHLRHIVGSSVPERSHGVLGGPVDSQACGAAEVPELLHGPHAQLGADQRLPEPAH